MRRRDLLFGALAAPALPKLLAAAPAVGVEGPPQWIDPPTFAASVEYFMQWIDPMYRIHVGGVGVPNTALIAQVPSKGALYLLSFAPKFPMVLGPWPVPDKPCSVHLTLIRGVAGSDAVHFGGDPPPGIVLSIFPLYRPMRFHAVPVDMTARIVS